MRKRAINAAAVVPAQGQVQAVSALLGASEHALDLLDNVRQRLLQCVAQAGDTPIDVIEQRPHTLLGESIELSSEFAERSKQVIACFALQQIAWRECLRVFSFPDIDTRLGQQSRADDACHAVVRDAPTLADAQFHAVISLALALYRFDGAHFA